MSKKLPIESKASLIRKDNTKDQRKSRKHFRLEDIDRRFSRGNHGIGPKEKYSLKPEPDPKSGLFFYTLDNVIAQQQNFRRFPVVIQRHLKNCRQLHRLKCRLYNLNPSFKKRGAN